MASEPTKFVGKIDCPICGEDLHVRQNGRDTLNISCICCGISSYAKGNTPAHAIVTAWLRDYFVQGGAPAAPAPAPAPTPAAPVAKQSAPAPAAQVIAKAVQHFSMGNL